MSNYRGPITNAEGQPLRGYATTNPGGERVEVELRAGRNGVVFVEPVFDPSPVEAAELPPNEAMRPVPPEARTTPFSVDDFGLPPLPEEELTEEELAEAEALIDPDAPRPDGSPLAAGRAAGD